MPENRPAEATRRTATRSGATVGLATALGALLAPHLPGVDATLAAVLVGAALGGLAALTAALGKAARDTLHESPRPSFVLRVLGLLFVLPLLLVGPLGCAKAYYDQQGTAVASARGDASATIGQDCLTDRSTTEVATGELPDDAPQGLALSATLTHQLDEAGNITSRTFTATGPNARITERRHWSEADGCAIASGGGLSESAGTTTRSWWRRAADVLIGVFGGALVF